MPRTSSNLDLTELLSAAMAPVLARAAAAIANAVAEIAEERIALEIASQPKRSAARARKSPARRQRHKVEMTVWAADRRARRVPKFVIEATGLDTKKKIVARFGDGATFERGKPLPVVKKNGGEGTAAVKEATAARVVKAKPPRVRRKAAAA